MNMGKKTHEKNIDINSFYSDVFYNFLDNKNNAPLTLNLSNENALRFSRI